LTRRARLLEEEVEQRRRVEADLRQANQKLDEFSHAVAHDLKEPLRGVILLASFLEEDAADRLTSDEADRLRRLRQSAEGMAHMLTVALEYARESGGGDGTGDNAVTNPTDVAERVLRTLQPWLDAENAQVIIHGPLPAVHCDEASVIRVFTNLIANGVKYNRSCPKIIELGVSPPLEGEPPVFYVRDNGLGVPPDKREKVFQMFRKPEPGEPVSTGTGAGLALTRKVIERHRGRIWIEAPTPDRARGTTFRFTLGPANAVQFATGSQSAS
jgi:signal transduction histidine kinase